VNARLASLVLGDGLKVDYRAAGHHRAEAKPRVRLRLGADV
jgi:hypothetical protein